MALDYKVRYPAQTVTDADYPQGKARDILVPGDGTGTPWQEDLTNDYWGLLQSLLLFGAITPTGTPDSTVIPQYFLSIIRVTRGPLQVANWTKRIPVSGSAGLHGAAAHETLPIVVAVGDGGFIFRSIHGQIYESEPTAGTISFQDAAHSDAQSLFVAVGNAGGVETSTNDGATWSGQTAISASQLNAVIWVNALSLFVTVGGGGVIFTSPTGLDATWTSQTSGTVENLNGVVYSGTLSLLVAVGANGVILTSANGVLWNPETSGVAENLRAVTFSGNLLAFIAVGNNGTILSSLDGTNWDPEIVNGTPDLLGVNTSDNTGQLVAVGDDSGIPVIRSVNRLGQTWTTRYNADPTGALEAITFSQVLGVFVTVGENTNIETSLFFGAFF